MLAVLDVISNQIAPFKSEHVDDRSEVANEIPGLRGYVPMTNGIRWSNLPIVVEDDSIAFERQEIGGYFCPIFAVQVIFGLDETE